MRVSVASFVYLVAFFGISLLVGKGKPVVISFVVTGSLIALSLLSLILGSLFYSGKEALQKGFIIILLGTFSLKRFYFLADGTVLVSSILAMILSALSRSQYSEDEEDAKDSLRRTPCLVK